jgi:quercetin dioxygenase-like cupin family protein
LGCQAPHTQCVISGWTKVGMDDGMKQQFAPGDVLVVPPRHNAVGNELGCR